MTLWKSRGWRWTAVLVVAALIVGCKPAPGPQQPPVGPGTVAKRTPESQPDVKPAEPKKPPPPATIPETIMGEKDRATCRVWKGDVIPDAELPDIDGKKVSLRSLMGKKLSVIVFWTTKSMDARQQLGDVGPDIAKKYAEKGVAVIGINEGDSPTAVREELKNAEATFPNLLDSGGQYFAKVATAKLPRTYLLDAQGKILWLDIVYSRTTLRDLETGIKVALGELK